MDLTCGRETLAKKSIKYFEEALAGPENPKLVDAIFGKARFFFARYNFSHALEVSLGAVTIATVEPFLKDTPEIHV